MKSRLYVFAVLIGIIFVYFVGKKMIQLERETHQTAIGIKETPAEPVSGAESTDEAGQTEEKIYIPYHNFEELKEVNKDIYAWIIQSDVGIDYPVLQGDTDNYYLDKNLDGSGGYPGCLYTNSCNGKDFKDLNTVIYGHSMKNGTMFGSIRKMMEKDFFEGCSEITVETPEEEIQYEIIAAVEFSDVYIPDAYPVNTEEGIKAFLAAVKTEADAGRGFVKEDIMQESGKRMVTLSTCVAGRDERRYLVLGYEK